MICLKLNREREMSLKFSIGYLVGLGSSGCGYCKSKEAGTSKSFGIWIYTMTVEQYQLMLDSGWYVINKFAIFYF